MSTTRGILLAILFAFTACKQEEIKNMKDLEQSMMDLKAYQENLGEYIRAGELEEAGWLLDGLDSTLETVSATITEHHRMKTSFSYYKNKLMDKPVKNLHRAFEKNDTAMANKNYILLVDNCNKCHIDHEIEKDVFY